LYATGLALGMRIFEYEKSFLHAKVAVIDREWATVGSSNIDPFSLLLAKEANLIVRDPVFAGELRASLHEAMHSGSREMLREEIQQRGWHSRFLRWLSYSTVRLLVGLAGYGDHHWLGEERIKPLNEADLPPH
jgi:cardiolipin synthase